MKERKHIVETEKETVVLEYQKHPKTNGEYQSETQLEQEFILQLVNQGYEYLPNVKNESSLKENLKKQIEKLNCITFSQNEWNRFLREYLSKESDTHIEKTEKIQKDYIYSFLFDNGNQKNIYIIDKDNIHRNTLQVINQYETIDSYNSKNRYDVSILVNGLPLVHIELKRRSQNLEEAFNQCDRYKKLSMDDIFQYVQIFIISNGTRTKYFANTTKKTNGSFKMTQYWSDAKNHVIEDLVDFTKYFFARHTILNVLTKYCVFNVDKKLMIMRPYQIVATEKIINQIIISNNYKERLSTTDSGGYIWHSTGSGKTLTSFKTAQLAKDLDFVDKVLFVVDRQDLDYQTIKEFNHFQPESANSNSSTKILTEQLESNDETKKIIITTIQKLSNFVKKYPKHDVYKKHVVMIFDECHRSQFGDMHHQITKSFKKYNIFGFTGTPIFAQNATKLESTSKIIKNINKENFSKKSNVFKTTEQLFGQRLHSYTILDAIKDDNVLKFKYEECISFKSKSKIEDKQVYDINKNEVFYHPQRIEKIVEHILYHFNDKTKRQANNEEYEYHVIKDIEKNVKSKKQNKTYKDEKIIKRLNGFNAMLAVQDVKLAKLYYLEFKKQIELKNLNLKIATIFSFNPNESYEDNLMGYLEEDNESTNGLDKTSRDFLASAIEQYNQDFNVSYNIGNEFKNYYKDISLRTKNCEIDLLIVVNMFLTGFDAPCLNTLYVDKQLKMHGLIQAFSRTNRKLNKIKTHGNIVSFVPLRKNLDDAITIFSNEKAGGIILLNTFDEYMHGYKNEKDIYVKGYIDTVNIFKSSFPIDQKDLIITNEQKKEFIKQFGTILQQRNILLTFDEFHNKDLFLPREIQDYCGWYQEFYDNLKEQNDENKESIIDDLDFEIELLDTYDVDVDYIISLITELKKQFFADKELLSKIILMINCAKTLRPKKELILEFIEQQKNNLNNSLQLTQQWDEFQKTEMSKELDRIINQNQLNSQKAKEYFNRCIKRGEIIEFGTDFNDIFEKLPGRFGKNKNIERRQKTNLVKNQLLKLLEKYQY